MVLSSPSVVFLFSERNADVGAGPAGARAAIHEESALEASEATVSSCPASSLSVVPSGVRTLTFIPSNLG